MDKIVPIILIMLLFYGGLIYTIFLEAKTKGWRYVWENLKWVVAITISAIFVTLVILVSF